MSLIKDWKLVALHAHSVHLSVGALVCWLLMALDSACGIVCGYLPLSPLLLGCLAGGLTLASLFARFIYQEKCHARS